MYGEIKPFLPPNCIWLEFHQQKIREDMVCYSNGLHYDVLQENQEDFWSFELEKPLGVQSLISFHEYLDYITGSNVAHGLREKWLSLECFG